MAANIEALLPTSSRAIAKEAHDGQNRKRAKQLIRNKQAEKKSNNQERKRKEEIKEEI